MLRQLLFSIPMRGNELMSLSGAGPTRSMFSIPMSGNETDALQLRSRACSMFSIPMRGNESCSGAQTMVSGTVFDPHEG